MMILGIRPGGMTRRVSAEIHRRSVSDGAPCDDFVRDRMKRLRRLFAVAVVNSRSHWPGSKVRERSEHLPGSNEPRTEGKLLLPG